jgi:hypoxanthine phosphoribosyltransferase
MKSYDYKSRKGTREISWDHFAEMCRILAERISSYDPELVIGIARAGLYPATLISGMLRKEFYPVRITRRENDQVKYNRPVWITDLPESITHKRILVVDEIADTGETMSIVINKASQMNSLEVRSAVLISHSWADPKPDYFVLESDKMILFPWDSQILIDGQWQLHPEIIEALNFQKRS